MQEIEKYIENQIDVLEKDSWKVMTKKVLEKVTKLIIWNILENKSPKESVGNWVLKHEFWKKPYEKWINIQNA